MTEPAGPSKFEVVQNAVLSRFGGGSSSSRDSTTIFSELAPVIMTPRMINNASTAQSRTRNVADSSSLSRSSSKMDFATLGRAPLRLGLGSRRLTSRDLEIVEATEELLLSDVPDTPPPQSASSSSKGSVSFLRGFNATIPSSEASKTRRRQMRSVETPRLGLKKLGLHARGLLTADEEDHDGQSVASEDDMVVVGRQDSGQRKGKRKGRESLSATKILGKEELSRQRKEILKDRENIYVRRDIIKTEIGEIARKINALDDIRSKLEQDLLKLQEDELELDDELEGVKERIKFEASSSQAGKVEASIHLPQTTRRRRGPSFLPSEHDELPPGVAFMTLQGHQQPITSLDFSEPYGTLVSASQEDSNPRVYDLLSGAEIGRLRGHTDPVKVVQVEGNVCLTGSEDGTVRLWDLRKVDTEDSHHSDEGEMISLSDVAEDEESDFTSSRTNGKSSDPQDPCTRTLEGHTKAVTALYFENDCLVTGASDKTLRQWDLTTGQCVMTMDILWAISHPQPSFGGGPSSDMFSGASAAAGSFAVPTPPAADGSWEMYQDFVGGVQFWGYGLVSGSGDAAVRMWDMRTGQAHRTLHGHTGPVTCVQFDETYVMSGSLDKTVKIWDLRTGGVFETLKYDHAVTALQFDTRKVVAATGENGIKIYNRTSMQHSSLLTNGHTAPVERLRFMDRYLVSGARDNTVKVWSL